METYLMYGSIKIKLTEQFSSTNKGRSSLVGGDCSVFYYANKLLLICSALLRRTLPTTTLA
jgi:hypothetical protein